MSVVQCYAPTNDTDKSVMEAFYIKLRNTRLDNERNGNIKFFLISGLKSVIELNNTGDHGKT